MDKICLHVTITGLVQGVWFRASTQEKAQSLGITGWTKNLNTGQVECMLCGTQPQLNTLLTWLHDGPPLAKVDKVEHEEVPCENFDNFDIK